MHYSQASIYARIGLSRLEDLYIKNNENEFDSVFINTNYEDNNNFFLDD